MKKIFLISACILFNEALAVALAVIASVLTLVSNLIAQIPNFV